MPVPVCLAHHGAHGGNEEEYPFVEVDVDLFGGGGAGEKSVGGVVFAEDVVDYGAGFPGHDAGVGVLWNHAVVKYWLIRGLKGLRLGRRED